ncbi:hypothetical protein BH09MYX1_BH09MYX1_00550 [soil metagenome]
MKLRPVAVALALATSCALIACRHDESPDNTGVNERDRKDAATPMTQDNSEADVKITAAIRQRVMADSSLGFNAKNVKIITAGNRVTLRGPVANEHERAAIEAYAKQAAGVTAVDNQLEVKD